jgi:hypothetical protein
MKKTDVALYMLLDALGGSEGLANIFTAMPNSEQIPPALGQLGAGETKTGAVNCKQLYLPVRAYLLLVSLSHLLQPRHLLH